MRIGQIAVVLVAVMLMVAPSVVEAAKRDSGNYLHDSCQSDNNFGFCLGYISGVIDGGMREEIKQKKMSQIIIRPHWLVCVPHEATIGQLVDVVKAFLEKHPEDRHFNAASLIGKALNKAFSCVK